MLAPLGPITPVLFGLAVALLALCLFVAFASPWQELVTQWLGPTWRRTYLGFLGVSVIILAAAMGLNLTAEGDRGALAQHVGAVDELQETLSMVDERTEAIAADTGQIRQDTGQIRQDTGQIKEDTSIIREEIGGLERETSEDPRKELANIGTAWTTQAYVEALMTGDERAVRLFLGGGMKAETDHKDASAVLYILQPTMSDAVPMLELLVEAGFDVDAELHDTRIMPHWYEDLPDHFEHPEISPRYEAWRGIFAGSALFWMTIISAYGGIPSEAQQSAYRYLIEQGADTSLSEAYLAQEWMDFEGYQVLRDIIKESR